MSCSCSFFSNVEFVMSWHHSRVGLQLWSIVPSVDHLSGIGSVDCKGKTTNSAGQEEIKSEHVTRESTWVKVGEVVHKSLIRDNWHSSLESGHSSANNDTKRPSKNKTKNCVSEEGELIRSLDLPLILPWPSFGASHVLSESVSEPWVAFKLPSQPENKR